MKFIDQSILVVEGQLFAGVSGGIEVVFTSVSDDTVGNNTDSIDVQPNRGSWRGIEVNPNKTNALLSLMRVIIRYASTGLYLVDMPDWDYERLVISDSQTYGISCDENSLFVPDDPDLILVDNGAETLGCPTPDR